MCEIHRPIGTRLRRSVRVQWTFCAILAIVGGIGLLLHVLAGPGGAPANARASADRVFAADMQRQATDARLIVRAAAGNARYRALSARVLAHDVSIAAPRLPAGAASAPGSAASLRRHLISHLESDLIIAKVAAASGSPRARAQAIALEGAAQRWLRVVAR